MALRERQVGPINLNLVVWDSDPGTAASLRGIAAHIAKIDGRIRVFVVPHHKYDQLLLMRQWFQPTLSLSLYHVPGRKLLPGRFVTGYFLPKHLEYRRLEAAAVPVPAWTMIEPGTRLDPVAWGPYVVEKPALGVRGANVRIRKTGRIAHVEPNSYPVGHYGREGPMLVQKFIYTGPWPTSYRVLTLFGEVLLCYRQISTGHGQPLQGRWGFRDAGGINIVSNTKDMKAELADDADIIALAERAHRTAFPECPVLGFDIVRDVDTGELFVLESHPQGSWLFSGDVGRQMQADNHIDFAGQFGALEKAAAILARVAPRLAARSMPFSPLLRRSGQTDRNA
jgi:hypothetical protein